MNREMMSSPEEKKLYDKFWYQDIHPNLFKAMVAGRCGENNWGVHVIEKSGFLFGSNAILC